MLSYVVDLDAFIWQAGVSKIRQLITLRYIEIGLPYVAIRLRYAALTLPYEQRYLACKPYALQI